MSGILRVLGYIRVLFVFTVPFAVLVEESGKPGPEKREEVVQNLKEEMENIGVSLPEWLEGFIDPLLGLIVDVVVLLLNRAGFFEHSTD